MTTTKLDEQSNRLHRRPTVDRPRQTIVATEAVLLWPRGLAKQAVNNPSPGLWPVLAVVLSDENASTDLSVRRLYDLLGRWCSREQVTVLAGRCLWSVACGRDTPLLWLAVRASAATKLEVDIVLPARPLLGAVGWLAGGGTVALTTRRHADRLSTGVKIRDALHGLVLVSCPRSPQLAALARARDEAEVDRQLLHKE
jgi:hypothetical protein